MSSQTVNVTAGAIEYTWPVTVTETGGKDISGDTVQISLGSYSEPGTWTTGVLTRPSASTATIKMLIDSSVAPGTYHVHVKVSDAPEIVPRRAHKVIVT